MEFQEQKRTFLRNLVMDGISVPGEIKADKRLGVPDKLVEKWCKQFKTVPLIDALPSHPRLVNGFTIGADPEMTIGELVPQYPNIIKQYAAMKLGLHTGLAFGMDMNGRLVEFRPYPSHFALDVVASLLAELRWLAMFHPLALKYQWISSPFDGQDGVGGHVHLARKRSKDARTVDILMLDKLYTAFVRSNILNKSLNDQRVSNTRYGHTGDIRLQRHGYEYRSFPTWLDDPWLAYLVLVVSKLSVIDRQLVADGLLASKYTPIGVERFINNLLAYYKNKDDDAWIAYHALLKWGAPKQKGGDIKAAWGLLYPADIHKCKQAIIPEYIIPSVEEKQDIFNYLVSKTPIPPRIPVCNWEPAVLPDGYEWAMNYTETYHKIGIGEIVGNLVTHKERRVYIAASDDRMTIQFATPDGTKPIEGLNRLSNNGRYHVRFVDGGDKNTWMLYLPQDLRTNEAIPIVKDILTSTDFPIWKAAEVKKESIETWKGRRDLVVPKNGGKFLGKELHL